MFDQHRRRAIYLPGLGHEPFMFALYPFASSTDGWLRQLGHSIFPLLLNRPTPWIFSWLCYFRISHKMASVVWSRAVMKKMNNPEISPKKSNPLTSPADLTSDNHATHLLTCWLASRCRDLLTCADSVLTYYWYAWRGNFELARMVAKLCC